MVSNFERISSLSSVSKLLESDDDIKFNAIYGEKSCAVDHNENGVVDEGEITSYDVTI